MATPALLSLVDVGRDFDVSRPWLNRVLEGAPRQRLHAVDGVSFELRRGETLALVGESGCGKSTLARVIVGLYAPSRGRIAFDGVDLGGGGEGVARQRRRMQMIFQDPYASLNPRWRVRDIVAEPLSVLNLAAGKDEIRARVAELLTQVGLAPEDGEKYPHEFSGGQRQRISIARAAVLEPSFVVLDEPTSALDMLFQAQMVDLLRELQRKRDLTYMFISHDLRVVASLASHLIVMRHGKVVEEGPAAELFKNPKSDYTRALFAAAFRIEAAPAGSVAT